MNSSNEWLFSLLMSVGRMLPMFIVWFIGLVIAVVRWPRCPAVSLLVFVAILVAGFASIATQVFYTRPSALGDTMNSARIASSRASSVLPALSYMPAPGHVCLRRPSWDVSSAPASASHSGATKPATDKPL